MEENHHSLEAYGDPSEPISFQSIWAREFQ